MWVITPSHLPFNSSVVVEFTVVKASPLNTWPVHVPVQAAVLANRLDVDDFVDGFASEAMRKASSGAPFNAGASVPKADDLAHYSAKH
jgi:hypothetical protein